MRHEQLTDDLQEQASLFAAGAMTESERKEYVRHLEEDQCAVCLSEVNELQSAVSMLAFSTASRSPSPSVQQRLLEQARNVASGKPIRSRSLLRRFWVDLIASSAAIAAIVVAFAVTRANTELRGLIDVLNSRIAQLEVQQLWFVPVSGNPVSAVVFNTATDGSAEIEIDVPEAVVALKAAAVTTEPAGGLPQPSGPFALPGAL